MKKGRIIEAALPEAMIQHIQSFMNGKEAARTTLISKSWYKAWLTRPSIDLDRNDLHVCRLKQCIFEEYATKTLQRYIDSSRKIDSFKLCCSSYNGHYRLLDELIVKAVKIGATNLTLEMCHAFNFPPEFLRSQIHLRLSLNYCKLDADWVITYSWLKSLILEKVEINKSLFDHIIKCCCTSLEELSLSSCDGISLNNRYELHKLRSLFLSSVYVGMLFSSDFASKFPCLKDLSIIECPGCKDLEIDTSSLQTINFKPIKGTLSAEFDVPNIRKFIFSGSVLPSQLSIEGSSREWEFDISIVCHQFHKSSWFRTLRKRLTMFRLSRITLSISLVCGLKKYLDEVHSDIVGEPLVVENLVFDDVPSSFCSALLIRLLGVFRPKFITHYWVTEKCKGWFFKNESLDIMYMRLMQQSISPSCGIPNQKLFGRFGLKKVNLEVYEMFGTEWRPFLLKTPLDAFKAPANKRKVRFELIWED